METEAVEAVPVRVEGPGRVQVKEYTDPYSVWCWGCEPAIRRFEYRYPGSVEVVCKMGGLFEDFTPMREYWTRMSGGRWKESVLTFMTAVAGQHRMPMNPEAMMETVDDFQSTWPACISVKAAERQGAVAVRRYLRRLREAAVVEGRAIHRRDVQRAVASESGLDVRTFERSLDDGSAERAFHEDLAECRAKGIVGFPTFELGRSEVFLRIEGFRPWEDYEDALRLLEPSLRPRAVEPTSPFVLELLRDFGRCATREVSAVFDLTDDEGEILLEELADRGEVLRRAVGTGVFWEVPEGSGTGHSGATGRDFRR